MTPKAEAILWKAAFSAMHQSYRDLRDFATETLGDDEFARLFEEWHKAKYGSPTETNEPE